jgi:hypothetical protein
LRKSKNKQDSSGVIALPVIPCEPDAVRQRTISQYIETLKQDAYKLGSHGLSEEEFLKQDILRGAVESMRGVYSGTTRDKKAFVSIVLNYMQDQGFIKNWEPAGEANRYDYLVGLEGGRIAAIETKGCLDGNNTNIFERPQQAHEFIIWSICTSPNSDMRHNAWSGIHTRLSAEIIIKQQRVDGLIIWDMLCGTVDRPCPKVSVAPDRLTEVAQFRLPPPCVYVFPGTTPHARNNPHPVAQALDEVVLLKAFHDCFGGKNDEVNYVDFDVEYRNSDTVRATRIRRGGTEVRQSRLTAIRRSGD